MFIEDVDGRLWNDRQIETIFPSQRVDVGERKLDRHGVKMRDGTVIQVSSHELTRFYRESAKMVPSEPDVNIVRVDPETGDVFKTRVIGWVIVQEEGVLPVTIDGVNDDTADSQHILFPDGTVQAYGEGTVSLAEHIEAEKSRAHNNNA